MLKHILLSCLLCALLLPGIAQQNILVYAEAGVVPRYRDVPYSVRAGLEFGRHDIALEYGIGSGTYQGYRYGLRYRLSLPEEADQSGVQPFVQGGLSWSERDYSTYGPGITNRSAFVDLATGLQGWLWRGFRLSAHAGLRYMQPFAGPGAPFVFDLGPRLYVAGGVGLAYALPVRTYYQPGTPEPSLIRPRLRRHEVGLSMTTGNVAHYFPYTDMRVHYAYRVHRHWDLRAAIDLPTWPLSNDFRFGFMNFWQPGVYAGARFWAAPTARFSVFGEGGLSYARRYVPWFGGFLQRAAVAEPSLGAGVRANFSPALSLELSSQLRLMPYPGIPYGLADNVIHLGLNFRFGSDKLDIQDEI